MLRAAFQSMTEGLVLQARDGRIIEANSAAESILGLTRDQLLGRTSFDPQWETVREDGTRLPSEEHPAMVTLRTGRPVRGLVMGVRDPGAGLRWISVNSQPIVGADGTVSAVVTTFIDITAQRRAAEELRSARSHMHAIVNRLPAMIGYWNRDLFCEFANDSYIEWFGLTPEQVIGMHMPQLLGEAVFRLNEPHVRQALQGQPQRFERRLVKADGTEGMADAHYLPDVDPAGVVRGFFVLVTDITALHEAYARNRELNRRLTEVREEERRAIAMTLHEGIAQDLFAMKLRLGQMEKEQADSRALAAGLRDLDAALDQCMCEARDIADDLMPTTLIHMGLREAIQHHGRLFADISGLQIDVQQGDPFPALPQATRITFFRAAQEALTNVARHAGASHVEIVLSADSSYLQLEVIDDGVGISREAFSKAGSLGLVGMQERLSALGGNLQLERLTPSGTCLRARLPRPV